MTKKIATDAVVFAAADTLLAEGREPTILLLQERTGGSYTTVQKALERWSEARAAQPPAPPEIAARGEQFVRALWAAARQQANEAAEEARRAARAQLEPVASELSHAQDHIGQLEQACAQLQRQLAEALANVDRERAHAQAQTERLERAEAQVSQCMQALEQGRAEVQQHLVRAATLEGRCAALDKQLAQVLRRTPPVPAPAANQASSA